MRFELREARGGWWVRDAHTGQWTACADAGDADETRRRLEEAEAGGFDAIARESLQWVRDGTDASGALVPEMDHATLLPPSDSAPPSDTGSARQGEPGD